MTPARNSTLWHWGTVWPTNLGLTRKLWQLIPLIGCLHSLWVRLFWECTISSTIQKALFVTSCYSLYRPCPRTGAIWKVLDETFFQNGIMVSNIDTLGILDCCYAGSARNSHQRVSEMLAECGSSETVRSRTDQRIRGTSNTASSRCSSPPGFITKEAHVQSSFHTPEKLLSSPLELP